MKPKHILENDLNLHLLRIHRKQHRPIDKTLGTTVDEYEAMLNDLQLQMQMLTSQAQQEVKNVETIKNEIEAQIKVQQEEIIKFLNNYSQSLVSQLMDSVKISTTDLKFKGTDVYDLSFLRNFDYSKVNLIKDTQSNMKRSRSASELRNKLLEYKSEFFFANGLVQYTDPYHSMYPLLVNQRNYFLMEYYRTKADYYNEVCIQGLLANPTNNLSTLEDFIKFNDENIKLERQALENQKLSLSVEEYSRRSEKIAYIERMVLMAKLRRNYIKEALESKWNLPSFDDIKAYAEKANVTYSRAIFELRESTNYTMLYPTWFMKIAEMYNMIQRFDEGEVVQVNPKDDRWIRKAGELVDLESGLNDAMINFLDATVDYWALLTFSVDASENQYVMQVLDESVTEFPKISQYPNMMIFPEFLIRSAIEDEADEQGLGGFFKKVFKSVAKAVTSVAKAVVETVVKIGNAVVKVVKKTFKEAQRIGKEVADEVRKGLENTLGKVLPESVWEKVRNLTDVALDVVSLNVTKATLRKAVDGMIDGILLPFRINEEMFKLADKVGVLKYADIVSGGFFSSLRRLNTVPMQLNDGQKINWVLVAIDALKVGATVFAVGSASQMFQEIGRVGINEYMARNATGISIIDKAIVATAMIFMGSTTATQALTDGSKEMGAKALLNNTNLGQSSLGRTAVGLGVNATVTSIASNTAFNDEAKKLAEIEAKKFMSSKAQKEVLEASGIKLPQKYADALSNSAYNYITNTSVAINDDGFYKDWMKVDINASSIINKVTKEAQNGFENAKEAITKLANYDYSKLKPEDRNYLEKMGILADDMKNGASKALDKASDYIQSLADKKLKIDMDDTYKLANKYSPKLFDYLWDKYGPRFDYDDLITPEDFLNYQIHVVTPGRRITKINWLSTNPANFALAGILGVAVVGLLAYNAE